jgi:hypothetical protein
MKTQGTLPSRFVLPLPRFVLQPRTAIVIAVVHIYLSVGHLSKLFGGDVQWTHFWKWQLRWRLRLCGPGHARVCQIQE